MRFPRTVNLGLPLFIFGLLLFLVLTDIFYFMEDSTSTFTDRIFYLIIHISFWLSTAFLFNSIINKFFWGGINKIPVGNYLLNKVRDFLAVLTYVIILSVILVLYFRFDFNFNLVAVGIIAAVIGMTIRPYLLSFFRSVFQSNLTAFNIGDWVKFTSVNGKAEITGEVQDIDRKNLKIKTEDSNIVTLSQESLSDFIIENYWGSGREARFEVDLNLDFSVSTKRAKRILYAAAKQAIEENDLLGSPEPQVSIKKITTAGIQYAIYYWILPWEKISPREAKDKIIAAVLEHLGTSGLSLSYPKEDIYVMQMSEREDHPSVEEDCKKIIQGIDLFDSLDNEELSSLSETLLRIETDNNGTIIQEGDEGDSMFIVVEGLLDVFVNSKEGHLIKVGRLTPGDFFGEMSLMTGEKRSATVKASTDVVLFEITKESIADIIEKRENVIHEFGEIISRRIQLNLKFQEEYEKSKHKFLNEIVNKIKKFFRKN